MIRDPSDGTVRGGMEREAAERETKLPGAANPSPAFDRASGLPLESQKPEAQAKLEKSREQLRNYRKTGLFQSTAEVAETECDHLNTERDEK